MQDKVTAWMDTYTLGYMNMDQVVNWVHYFYELDSLKPTLKELQKLRMLFTQSDVVILSEAQQTEYSKLSDKLTEWKLRAHEWMYTDQQIIYYLLGLVSEEELPTRSEQFRLIKYVITMSSEELA